MKTKRPSKNPPKKKPLASGTKRRGKYKNEPSNLDSGEGNKNTKKNYFKLMLQSETPEQRAQRLQKVRDSRLKKLATETEEERLKRKRLEAIRKQNLHRKETPEKRVRRLSLRKKNYREKREKLGHSIRPQRPYTYETIIKVLGNFEHPEETITKTTPETTVQRYAITYGTKMKKATKFDVVSNILHAICRKSHPQCKLFQQNHQEYFNSRASTIQNHILVTIIWQKYRKNINNEIKDTHFSQL